MISEEAAKDPARAETPSAETARDLTAGDDAATMAKAVAIAARLLVRADELESGADRRRRRRIAAVVGDEASRDFLTDLTDQVLRISSTKRSARRLHDLVASSSAPAFAEGLDGVALALGGRLAPVLPGIVMPIATARLRRELAGVVLPAEQRSYARHAKRRRAESIRLNVNLLGEAVLGEGEARARTDQLIELLGRPDVDYVSVKISSICAQLDVLAYDHSLDRIVTRLREVFRAAASSSPAKFVNLDMEEYRDLDLTIDAFTRLLAEPDFVHLDAGIVLQAYLPDSAAALGRIAGFARERYAAHGSQVKVRIVKGANLAMERVEAELRGWEQAPYASKADVDANYKRLLDIALAPENAGALRLGVASHNLFDVGWALARREAAGAMDRVEIEMLEGMANPQALATSAEAGGLLLYAPIVRRDDFASAVAYLVRRFDENTSPENFLAQLFDLAPGSPAWITERDRFRTAVAHRHDPAGPPRRQQDRSQEEAAWTSPESQAARAAALSAATADPAAPAATVATADPALGHQEPVFSNTPDTDFTLPANRAWLARHLESWSPGSDASIPAVVGGTVVSMPLSGVGIDPSSPGDSSHDVLYAYVEADAVLVDRAVDAARVAGERWAATDPSERQRILHKVADTMAAQRGRTLAVMAHDAAKTIGEGDPEISEAIDFARYYADQALGLPGQVIPATGSATLSTTGSATFSPYGVVLVAPPWNFPYAIPAGGIFGALAAGAAVIVKPAPETVLTAWTLVRQCWEAGVPQDVLQFVPTADDEVGRHLVSHPGVDAVVLTGAFETARMFLSWKPEMALHAETSGKNALVISAAADQDDAISDLVRSAFLHAGQKCSAASLAIVEASVYDDESFLARLADAVTSLRVGPAYEFSSQVGPLIHPPTGALLRALTVLEAGQRWLVQPKQLSPDGHQWSPGVKLGVAPGSEFHLTECFGPVLGLMRARDLDEAITLQNAPAYGLTGGLHTLDDAEIARWLDRVEVGNAYVNRHTTGAIVRRQPFGGWKRSVVGPGAKAGGPHYVASFGRWTSAPSATFEGEIERARVAWAHWSEGEDPSGLCAERNVLRLRAIPAVTLRFGVDAVDTWGSEVARLAVAIATMVGSRIELSLPATYESELAWAAMDNGAGVVGGRVEDTATFVRGMTATAARGRVRLVGDIGARLALMDAGFDVDIEALVFDGERELLRWTREQAISQTMHRHGNVRPAASTP